MGVIHKLKKEVVDFIIEKKKSNPKLSCRKISDLIQIQFSIPVSKSSVNSVLKESNLSSPVGRRSKSRKSKDTFKIPEEKKQEIFEKNKETKLIEADRQDEHLPEIKKDYALQKENQSEMIHEKTSKDVKPIALPQELPTPPEELAVQRPQRVDIDNKAMSRDKMGSHEKEELSKEDIEENIVKEMSRNENDQEKKEEEKTDEHDKILKYPFVQQDQNEKHSLLEESPTQEKKESNQKGEADPLESEDIPKQEKEELTREAEQGSKRETKESLQKGEGSCVQEEPPEKPKQEPREDSPEESEEELDRQQKEPLPEDQAQEQEPVTEEEPVFDREIVSLTPKEALFDHMGFFFLKAAENDLSPYSILGGLLSKYSSVSASDVNLASEIILYMRAFGMDKTQEIMNYKGKGLWVLNSLEKPIEAENLLHFVENINNPRNLSLEMSNEYSQVFSEASYIKLQLSDGTVLCIDTQCHSIWDENTVHSGFCQSFDKALEIISKRFISNNYPCVLQNIPGYNDFSKEFFEFVWAFENISQKTISSVSIHNGQKDLIAQFKTVPKKKRSFIAGAWPWQEGFKKYISKDTGTQERIFIEGLEREFIYSQITDFIDQPLIGQKIKLRIAFIREKDNDFPNIAIVTNSTEKNMSIQDVISHYILHWPNFKEGFEDFGSKVERPSFKDFMMAPSPERVPLFSGIGQYNLLGGWTDLWTIIEFLLSALNHYCQRHFFPDSCQTLDFSTIKERFYDLEGSLQESGDLTIVTLIIPENYGYAQDLKYAIRRINERDIRISRGKKIFFKCHSG